MVGEYEDEAHCFRHCGCPDPPHCLDSLQGLQLLVMQNYRAHPTGYYYLACLQLDVVLPADKKETQGRKGKQPRRECITITP